MYSYGDDVVNGFPLLSSIELWILTSVLVLCGIVWVCTPLVARIRRVFAFTVSWFAFKRPDIVEVGMDKIAAVTPATLARNSPLLLEYKPDAVAEPMASAGADAEPSGSTQRWPFKSDFASTTLSDRAPSVETVNTLAPFTLVSSALLEFEYNPVLEFDPTARAGADADPSPATRALLLIHTGV
jgi:hypothetical protein